MNILDELEKEKILHFYKTRELTELSIEFVRKSNRIQYDCGLRNSDKAIPRVAGIYAIYFDPEFIYIGFSRIGIRSRFLGAYGWREKISASEYTDKNCSLFLLPFQPNGVFGDLFPVFNENKTNFHEQVLINNFQPKWNKQKYPKPKMSSPEESSYRLALLKKEPVEKFSRFVLERLLSAQPYHTRYHIDRLNLDRSAKILGITGQELIEESNRILITKMCKIVA